MNHLARILRLLLIAVPLVFLGCGNEMPPEIPPEEDPALSDEGNPAADAATDEVDPAL